METITPAYYSGNISNNPQTVWYIYTGTPTGASVTKYPYYVISTAGPGSYNSSSSNEDYNDISGYKKPKGFKKSFKKAKKVLSSPKKDMGITGRKFL
ncbi:MAG: hypothetical protein K6G11_02380 [Lachnospiraceae bacterium]|nr:hypothetical protein [Lachnospiraceae bacterium]